jgi:hypothetical protein
VATRVIFEFTCHNWVHVLCDNDATFRSNCIAWPMLQLSTQFFFGFFLPRLKQFFVGHFQNGQSIFLPIGAKMYLALFFVSSLLLFPPVEELEVADYWFHCS